MKRRTFNGFWTGLFFLISVAAHAQEVDVNSLFRQFVNPGSQARPRVWWHWMNGNITQDGIRKDLMWMYRSGIGGFQNFDAGLSTPQVVEKRMIYMTPEWKDAFRFTTRLADSLGLEMAIAGSPGWSESGGPWVEPKDGMKKVVWSEVRLRGGETFNGKLPGIPTSTGVFQNLPYDPGFGAAPVKIPPEFHKSIAVVAFRLPDADLSLKDLAAKVTSSGGDFTLSQLTDGDLAATALLPADTISGFAWIQFAFPNPVTIKAITLVGGGARSPFGFPSPSDTRSLEASDDGISYKRVSYLPVGGIPQQTIDIPPTKAKYFRVVFKNPAPPLSLAALMGEGGQPQTAPAGTEVAELVLHTVTRINRSEEKAGYAAALDLESHHTPQTDDVVAPSDIVDLTTRLTSDGSLNWTAPTGTWKVIWFGYSLTGKENHPASPESTGLEVDKLNARAVQAYFTNYLDQYREATGGLMGLRGLQYVITDSYEAGQENWTDGFDQEFLKRRGYKLIPWLPVLTGQVIESSTTSEKFLWDFRKTISELVVENHYDQLTTILERYGMKRYTEAHENGRVLIADGMDIKRTAAIPMSAMWTRGGSSNIMAQADIRESASVAHIYGQNLVAAESLTAFGLGGNAWAYYPGNLKPTADLELASGLNRFVIHTSVHQPVDDKIPGLGLGPFGQWFNRHDTWANQAKAWTDYLARSSYLLQEGRFVADIVYYYGEDNNITGLFGAKLPEIPEGYAYDFINADALVRLLDVRDKSLVTPSGMVYRVLVLDDNAKKMSLPVLRKINQLYHKGAAISGAKPEMSPSLSDDPAEFQRLVSEIWDDPDGQASGQQRRLFNGVPLQQVLDELKLRPDFSYERPVDTTTLMFVHRKLATTDIYWVNNRTNDYQKLQATFRVSGRAPEIWHPETGQSTPASFLMENGQTRVSLDLTPNDAVFVVFGKATDKRSVNLAANSETELLKIDGPWNVSFQPGRGAPTQARFEKLDSYTDNADPGIKYFSGEAVYQKTFSIPAGTSQKGARTFLDLGDVKNLAELTLNGKSLGILWKQPFRADITDLLKDGQNVLSIKIVNLWVNRLIGDAQPGEKNKITYTSMPFYRADSPLIPAGLLGPVRLLRITKN